MASYQEPRHLNTLDAFICNLTSSSSHIAINYASANQRLLRLLEDFSSRAAGHYFPHSTLAVTCIASFSYLPITIRYSTLPITFHYSNCHFFMGKKINYESCVITRELIWYQFPIVAIFPLALGHHVACQ